MVLDVNPHPYIEFVYVQYRRKGEGEWMTAWGADGKEFNFKCDSSRGAGCSLHWDLEKQYLLRCAGG